MDDNELMEAGLTPCRIKLAAVLRSKIYDIFMIMLILAYTLLIFVFFAIPDDWVRTTKDLTFIELGILGIFVIEIALHLFAFGCLYLDDKWNVFDLIVIILSIVFVILDMFVNNKVVESILKIRGIFRLLRIFILI